MDQQAAFLSRSDLQVLLDVLGNMGFRCIGPCVHDGAIVYDTLVSTEELPAGYHDEQAPARYRVKAGYHPRYFSWANGPQALKPLVFAPREVLWSVRRDAQGQLQFVEAGPDASPLAVIGVRPCDLAALKLQDQHFLQGDMADPYYGARRRNLFLVAVNCSHPADTCFCASTGDGPAAESGYDLLLDELDDGFLIRFAGEKGREVFDKLPLQTANQEHEQAAREQIRHAAAQQRRTLPSQNLKDVLFERLGHARWDEVAQRCLSCGNCTAVCPTCFCHSEQDEGGLDLSCSEHCRQWDSCFTQGHSYIHGMTIRKDTRLRYRQWLTHKLGSWHEQYGRSGCVGCGRCISWCPAAIDITEEAAVLCEVSDER